MRKQTGTGFRVGGKLTDTGTKKRKMASTGWKTLRKKTWETEKLLLWKQDGKN